MWRATVLSVLGFIVAVSGAAAERHEGSSEQNRICVRNLSHALPRMRAAAARALAEIGGETAVEPLIERLSDADADVRLSSASALGRINKRPLLCIEQLTKLLHDKDEHVRYAAQWAIGQFAEDFLQSSTTESTNSQPIRQLFASAAGVMAQTGAPETIQKRVREASEFRPHNHSPQGTASKSAVDLNALVADLKAEDIYLQVRALARLKDIEPKNIAQLVRMLAAIREESAMEWQIPESLAEAGREIVPGLVEVLQGDDEEARRLALDVLTETRYGAEAALPQLNRILANKDSGEDELERAIITISKLGPAAKESTSLLAKVAANRELPETVRTEAIEALAAIGWDAEFALRTIKRLLQNKEESDDLRIAAAGAVVNISRKSEDSLKLLTGLIENTDDANLSAAFAAKLGNLLEDAAPAVRVLMSLLKDPDVDRERRQELILAIGEIGPAADEAISTLIDLLVDQQQDESIQVAAAMTIGKLGPDAVSALADQFVNPDYDTRATIARAMVALGPQAVEAIESLVQVATNEQEADETRSLAVIALGKIGPPASQAAPALTKLLQSGGNPDALRAMSAVAIGSIDPESENVLQDALNDPLQSIQVAAAYAIVKLQRDSSEAALEQLVKLLGEQDADELASRALADIGSDAVGPLCSVIFNPAEAPDHRLRCVEVLGEIGTPAVPALIGLLDKPELAETAQEALARQSEVIVPVLLLSAESTTEFTPETRETMKELVRGFYDGLGAGPAELTWGEAHPLALLSEGPRMGDGAAGSGGSGSGKKVIRLGPPIAVMGKIPSEVNAKGFKPVKVFYGTNRKQDAAGGVSMRRVTLQVAAITALALCIVCLWFHTPRHYLAISMSFVGLVVIALPLALSLPHLRSMADAAAGRSAPTTSYGGDYSDHVEMGVCEVTIPDIHEEGELEGPSLLRLEIKVDPERHIVLQSVQPLARQAFFTDLQSELNQKGRNVLVFVHGFNVSFEDAARRTAQMAADLKFPGAAVFYSWPSQAHWYKYRLDEKNAELSVGQLKSFLLAVAEQSQATTINLVAHSMGNRLLTEALGELDASARHSGTLFNQVVLAAPDIDAAIFKNRIAPNIVTKAHRITLYASSRDLALYASRQFNSGDARAGDAGDDVLVIPGIETIDASAGDCSLLGHCYYGDSVSILHDIQQLLADRPARDRQFLYPISRSGSTYWMFEPDGIASQPRVEGMVR